MSRKLAAFAAAIALAGATPATASAIAPSAVAAKACSAGFKEAKIGGEKKCLRRGQFCAQRYDSQYRRYGYRCTKRDNRGSYHLT